MRRLYIQTRLYNVNDRLASLTLCEHIDQWIDQKLLADMVHCYLPYRDSDSAIGEVEDVSKAIFELDVKMLRECVGVVGFFDGAHYVPGCAFEIGLGYVWGYPINIITTDYYTWSVGDSSEFYIGSKLLEHIAKIVHVPDQDFSISDYRKRSEDQLRRAIEAFKKNLIEDFGTVKPPAPPLTALPNVYDYYIDPNFKYTESGRMLLEEITSAIKSANKSFIVGDNQGDIAKDIDNLRQSAQAIFFSDVFEPNVDSSLLQGMAYGLGKGSIVYTSNQQRYNSGGTVIGRHNFMIGNSAEIVSSLAELKKLISAS